MDDSWCIYRGMGSGDKSIQEGIYFISSNQILFSKYLIFKKGTMFGWTQKLKEILKKQNISVYVQEADPLI